MKTLFRRWEESSSMASVSDVSGLNTAAKDHQGRNAISHAAGIGDTSMLELLLRYCPEEANVPDDNGWVPVA